MEQILQKTLRDNEKVLWFGRPTKTKLLRSPDRVSQYVAWIITAVRPYRDKKLLEQKTIYAITDQRIIAVVKSNVMTMPRDQKVTCAVECRDGGAGNVCFNAAIGREAGKSRANAVMGIKKGNDRVVGLLFFHVSDPDAVVSALA